MRVRTVQDDPWKSHQWDPSPQVHTTSLPALTTQSVPGALDQWPHCLNKFNTPPPPPAPAWPVTPYPFPAYPHSYPGTPYVAPTQPGTYPFIPIHLPPPNPAARPMIPPGPIPTYQPPVGWNPPSDGDQSSGSPSSNKKSPGMKRGSGSPEKEEGPPVPEKDFPPAAVAGDSAAQFSGAAATANAQSLSAANSPQAGRSTGTAATNNPPAAPTTPPTQPGHPPYGPNNPVFVFRPRPTHTGSTPPSPVPQLRIPSPSAQSQGASNQSWSAAAASAASSSWQRHGPTNNTSSSSPRPQPLPSAHTQPQTQPLRHSPPTTYPDTPSITVTFPTPAMPRPRSSFPYRSPDTSPNSTSQSRSSVEPIYAPAVHQNQSPSMSPSSMAIPSFTPFPFSPRFYMGDFGLHWSPGSVSSSPQAHISTVPSSTSPTPSIQPTTNSNSSQSPPRNSHLSPSSAQAPLSPDNRPSVTTPTSSSPLSSDSPIFYRNENGWDYYPRGGVRPVNLSLRSAASPSPSPRTHISPVSSSIFPTSSAQPTPPRPRNPSPSSSPRSTSTGTPEILLQPPSSAGSYDGFHHGIHSPSPHSPRANLHRVLNNSELLHPYYASPRISGRGMDSIPISEAHSQAQQQETTRHTMHNSPHNPSAQSPPTQAERDQIRQAMQASLDSFERLNATYDDITRHSPLNSMLQTPSSVQQNLHLTIHPLLLGPWYTTPPFEWDMRVNPDGFSSSNEQAMQLPPELKLRISCSSQIPALRYLSSMWGAIESSPDSVKTVLKDIFDYFQTPLSVAERRMWMQFKAESAGLDGGDVKRYYDEVLEPRNETRRVDVLGSGRMFSGIREDERQDDGREGAWKFSLEV